MSETAIVTGASRGIGREVSMVLAAKGLQVLALARSEKPLMQLEAQFPSQIHAYTIDLTSNAEIDEFVHFFRDQFASLDILVNNAGGLVNKPFEKLTTEDWNGMLGANLLSNIFLTRSLIPHLNNPSHIVNISSMGGFQGSSKFPGLSAYSVAKGAVSVLSECLAVELAEHNISVNALCLGAVQTEMLSKAFPEFEAPVTAYQMGRYVADFALNGSTFYNGQVLPVTLADPG